MTIDKTPPTLPELRRYAPSGLCAIEPAAFGLEFPIALRVGAEPFRLEADGKVAVVDVSGPLTFDGFFFQSYDSIVRAVAGALASSAEAVILKIHSPGGDVYGCFEAARALRREARASGKRLIAFTGSQACSSAYALASAADEIVITESAHVGSVGVIATTVESTRADAAMGLSFAIITSGARKADGNQHVALSDDARTAMQRRVDTLAAVFFAVVLEHRGVDAAPLEAEQFIGAEAVSKGLADSVESWDALVARAAEGVTLRGETPPMADKTDDKEKDETRKALSAAAEDKDEKKSARAKRALAAYDEDKDEKASADDEEKKDDDKAKAKASDDDKNDDKAQASVAGSTSAISALELSNRELRAQAALLTARLDAADRTAFFAGRPDLSPELVKSLAATPLDQVKAIVSAIPLPSGFKSQVVETARPPAAGAAPAVLGTTVAELPPNPELDRAMGLAVADSGPKFDPKSQTFTFGKALK
jgi:capsid assembly protease